MVGWGLAALWLWLVGMLESEFRTWMITKDVFGRCFCQEREVWVQLLSQLFCLIANDVIKILLIVFYFYFYYLCLKEYFPNYTVYVYCIFFDFHLECFLCTVLSDVSRSAENHLGGLAD